MPDKTRKQFIKDKEYLLTTETVAELVQERIWVLQRRRLVNSGCSQLVEGSEAYTVKVPYAGQEGSVCTGAWSVIPPYTVHKKRVKEGMVSEGTQVYTCLSATASGNAKRLLVTVEKCNQDLCLWLYELFEKAYFSKSRFTPFDSRFASCVFNTAPEPFTPSRTASHYNYAGEEQRLSQGFNTILACADLHLKLFVHRWESGEKGVYIRATVTGA